jgi:soluble lytic murein transglycosylase
MQGRRYDLRLGKTWARLGIFVVCATTLPTILAPLSGSASAQSLRTSALTPGSETVREADLPLLLATDEAERYRRIFALQEGGHWAAADIEIAALADRVLLGAVEAQRYLHKAYRASFAELTAWLDRHADEPEAKAIYALARHRQPPGARPPRRPVVAAAPAAASVVVLEPERHPLSAAQRRQAQLLRVEIRVLAFLAPQKASSLLAGSEAKLLLEPRESDELRSAVLAGYLAAGKARQVLDQSAATEDTGAADVDTDHWQAGLAAWRRGRIDEAGTHFQALARSSGQASWTIAGAAFWAARVELRHRRPELFRYWLGIAAEHPRTFYGVLARRIMGIDAYFDFETMPFTEADAQLLRDLPAGRRTLALLQVGETARAEGELRLLATHAAPVLLEAIVILADRANMPGLSLQLAGRMAEGDGRHHAHALYPVPRWTPRGGFTVDRALLFAVMRQESQFLPHVQSYAGAMGLMQLMPATAHAMAERTGMPLRGRGERQTALADPELNMTLAQEYISVLIADGRIKGNLVLLAAAYNYGPSALQHWQPTLDLRQDPLLFIESLPSQQTRVFTERVLANYWIYRQRLGQPSPDLDALAAGQWPTYTALDSTSETDRRHAENR